VLHLLGYTTRSPDERRRGTLFNIFLFGVFIPVLGLLGVNTYSAVIQAHPDALIYVAVDLISLACLSGLWFLHRLHPRLARHLFLLFLVLAPLGLFEVHLLDRVLVTLTIPVMMAAFLLTPESSFIYAIVEGLAYSAIILRSYALGEWGDDSLIQVFNYPSVLSIFALTCVAWVVSRFLNQALAESQERTEELRVLNEELDQRVQERTLELAKALEREHAMAVRNQTILESIGDGVLVTDSYGRVILSNPAANRLAQRNLEAIPLQEALGKVQAEVLASLASHMTDTMEDEWSNIQFEWNQRTVAANIAPIHLDASSPAHFSGGHVMVLRDITREAALNRMKTIFLGSVSHELRTPMTAIKGYVDLLSDLEGKALSEAGRKYLGIVSTNIKQLLSLANDLIDMSRIEVGELALYPEWTELEPIVNGAVDTVRPEFEKRGLSLGAEIEPDVPLLYLDRHRITQVLLNLLTNAYKYTVEGGATVKVSHNHHEVLVEVSDTGVGITEEEQTHLFERFFRSSNNVVQKAGGSGLGLTIAKSMVELHGGNISVDSEYKVGTTFTVSLPIAEVPEPARERRNKASSHVKHFVDV
jgi:signal transduction histidine kinase